MGGRAMPTGSASVARTLRRNATNAARRLWQGLRRKEVAGFRFRRQDGATHSTDGEHARDADRTAVLAAQRFALLRFTNDEVFHNLDGVLETIRLRLKEPRPRVEGSTT